MYIGGSYFNTDTVVSVTYDEIGNSEGGSDPAYGALVYVDPFGGKDFDAGESTWVSRSLKCYCLPMSREEFDEAVVDLRFNQKVV